MVKVFANIRLNICHTESPATSWSASNVTQPDAAINKT